MPIKMSLSRGSLLSTVVLLAGVAVAHSQQAGSGSSRTQTTRGLTPSS